MCDKQPVRLASSNRCWFVKKYCWLVCVREKYYSGRKFTIVYDKPQPNEQAEDGVYTYIVIGLSFSEYAVQTGVVDSVYCPSNLG